MVFGPCHRNYCVNVPIVNDNRVEATRIFTYGLERTEDLDRKIQISSSTGRLTIIDDPNDGKWIMCSPDQCLQYNIYNRHSSVSIKALS